MNRDGKIFAYEILFRNSDTEFAEISDNLRATSSVLLNLLQNFGIHSLLGDKIGFINIDETVLTKDVIDLIPPEKAVLEILETTAVTDSIISRIREYITKGYTFALDDYVFTDEYVSNFECLHRDVNYIKIDFMLSDKEMLPIHVGLLKKRLKVKLLAEKVETKEEFLFCKELGFDLFQGYYFAKPSVVSVKKRIEPSKAGLLKLINILKDETSKIEVIEAEFKRFPELNFNLLKFINSSAFFLRGDVTSIHHAIAMIGRTNLSKWLMLMLYAGRDGDVSMENPLMLTALERAVSMESIAGKCRPNLKESAFLVGLVSLLEVIFEAPFDDFIHEFNLSSAIKEAVMFKKGDLGLMYELILLLEQYSIEKAEALLSELGLNISDARDARMTGYVSFPTK
jgi:EAL and modified HD-GYP domain-containing signal transduction protein